MSRERFWFGTAMLGVPVLLLLLLVQPPVAVRRSGPIEGRVSIRGRPMTGGFIVFVPEDKGAQMAIGQIDATGHYKIRSRLHGSDVADEVHYRICLIPPGRAFSGWWRIPADRPGGDDARGEGPPTDDAARLLRRVTDPGTTNLEAHLGPAPMRVDIALR